MAAKNTAKKDTEAAKQEPREELLLLDEVHAVLAEKLFADYVNARLDSYLMMLEK